MSPTFKSEDFKKEIFSKGILPKIFFILLSSKYENQSLNPGIGYKVPKCFMLGNSS